MFNALCCVFCFVFLVYPMLPVSLDCTFMTALSAFSNVYSNAQTFIKQTIADRKTLDIDK